jgi:hypothetical protein
VCKRVFFNANIHQELMFFIEMQNIPEHANRGMRRQTKNDPSGDHFFFNSLKM